MADPQVPGAGPGAPEACGPSTEAPAPPSNGGKPKGNGAIALDWKRRLAKKPKGGEFYPDERNVWIALALAPELHEILQYNEFSDYIELRRPLPGMPKEIDYELFKDYPPTPWNDEHVTELIRWLTQQGFTYLKRGVVQDTVVACAKRRSYHPVREYLDSLQWDGTERLTTWLKVYLGAKNHAAYLELVGPKWLTGAVARIYEPGCQMDTILVLEGEQGEGKSSACQILGRTQWTRDCTGDLSVKDAAIHIQSVWIAEMAELTSLRRGQQEGVKAFISRRIDHYRPPYGRNAVDRPRHTVFIATTNENEYLVDETGARRFWPVETSVIDLMALERDVDQLWAEAVCCYRDKQVWHLSKDERLVVAIEQVPRQRMSEPERVVLEYADSVLKNGEQTIVMGTLLAEVFTIDTRKDPQKAGALATQAARALTRGGWRGQKPTGRGPNRKKTYRYISTLDDLNGPESLISTKHSQAESDDPNSQATSTSQAKMENPEDDIPF